MNKDSNNHSVPQAFLKMRNEYTPNDYTIIRNNLLANSDIEVGMCRKTFSIKESEPLLKIMPSIYIRTFFIMYNWLKSIDNKEFGKTEECFVDDMMIILNDDKYSHIHRLPEKYMQDLPSKKDFKLLHNMILNVYLCRAEQEFFRPIPGFSSYGISKEGTVVRLKNLTVIKPGISLGTRGYAQVVITADDREKYTRKIHHLVLLTYVGPRPDGLVIDHINGVKHDNRLVNLEYVTAKENTVRAHKLGLARNQKGELANNARLTEEQVVAIIKDPGTYKSIGLKYDISPTTVGKIKQGKIWGIVFEKYGLKKVKPLTSVLDKEMVQAIYKFNGLGIDIVKEFGVSAATVSEIRTRRSYKEFTEGLVKGKSDRS